MPVRIDGTEPKNLHKTLEYFIATHHWFDASQGQIQDHLGNISDKVYHFLEMQGTGQNGKRARQSIETASDGSDNSPEPPTPAASTVLPRKSAMSKVSMLGFVILIVVGSWIFISKEGKVPEKAKEKPIEAATQNSSDTLWNIWGQLGPLSGAAQEDLSVSLNQSAFKLGETVVITCDVQRDGYLNVLNMNKGDDAVTAEQELSIGLHSLQDVFSHAQISPMIHTLMGEFPDIVKYHPLPMFETALATESYLKKFIEGLNLQPLNQSHTMKTRSTGPDPLVVGNVSSEEKSVVSKKNSRISNWTDGIFIKKRYIHIHRKRGNKAH